MNSSDNLADHASTSTQGLTESESLLGDTQASPQIQPQAKMQLNNCWDSGRRLQVDLLAGLFGVSAWLAVNALFTQLPILVDSLPEGWDLPSYLTILIQIANVGPILYSIGKKYSPSLVPECRLIYCVLTVGTVAPVLIAFFYDETLLVFGKPHSVALFILSFCISLVGCTSSVLFIPFMNNFPEIYLVSYILGEGLGGFLPSIISLIQGVGGNPSCLNKTTPTGVVIEKVTSPPKFSTKDFFFVIFSIMALSLVSFILLNTLPTCKEQKIKSSKRKREEEAGCDRGEPQPSILLSDSSVSMSPTVFRTLLFVTSLVSMFSNGALPSVQSYSCLPYGNLAYHLAVNLSNMANPVACFLAFFVPPSTPIWIGSLLSITAIFVSYLMATAFMSPNPPLQNTSLGIALIVISWTISSGLISYIKISIATLYRKEGGAGLYFYGGMTQVGSTIGSAIMFYLINYPKIFTSYDPCIAFSGNQTLSVR